MAKQSYHKRPADTSISARTISANRSANRKRLLYKRKKKGIINMLPQSAAKHAPVAQLDSAFDSDNCAGDRGQGRKRMNERGNLRRNRPATKHLTTKSKICARGAAG